MFKNVSHVHPSLVFAGKAGAYQSGAPPLMFGSGLSANIRLRWKSTKVANTLAYFDMASGNSNCSLKFYGIVPWGQSYQTFTGVIYGILQ